jgi:hypothetical protein
MVTVTDEEALQHVNLEMEAKATAPFASDRLEDSFHSYLTNCFMSYLSKPLMYSYICICMVCKNKIVNNCWFLGLFFVFNNANNQMVKQHMLTIFFFQELLIILSHYFHYCQTLELSCRIVWVYNSRSQYWVNTPTKLFLCKLGLGESKTLWLIFLDNMPK